MRLTRFIFGLLCLAWIACVPAWAQQGGPLPSSTSTWCIDLSLPPPFWKPCGQLAAANGQRVEMIPSQVFFDDFGTGTLDTTAGERWNSPTAAGGGVAASNAVGQTTLQSGTAAGGYSYLTSQQTFPGRSPAFLLFHSTINLQSPEIAGNYKAFGFVSIPATPTTAAPLTNAVAFEVTPTGKLQAVTYASGGRTLIADLSVFVPGATFPDGRLTPQPTDGKAHLYQIWFRGDYTEYDIDQVQVATWKSGAFGPDINNLAIGYLTINGTGGANSTIQVNQATVADEGRNNIRVCDPTFSWRCTGVNATGGMSFSAQDSLVLNGPLTCSAACTNTTLLGPIDTTGYQSASVQVTSAGTGATITYQGSDDLGACSAATNWVSIAGVQDSGLNSAALYTAGVPATTTTATGSIKLPVTLRCFRSQITAYGSGTVTAEGYLRINPGPQQVLGGQIGTTAFPTTSVTAATTITNATSTALEATRAAKSSGGNVYGAYATAIAGGSAGFLVGYNATACPADGAVTGALVLDSCAFDTSNKGCSISRLPGPARNYSAGICFYITTGASPFANKATGTDTGYLSVDYQ